MKDTHDTRTWGEGLVTLLERATDRAEDLLRENEALRKQVAELEAPGGADLEESAFQDGERETLLESVEERARENLEFAGRLADLERENGQIINLYVANCQLHATLRLPEVLKNIVEIIINLVGAERFVVYLLEESSGSLQPMAAEGANVTEFPCVSPDAVPSTPQTVHTSDDAQGEQDASRPIAWIPLRVDDRQIGAIAIYKLLTQKDGFAPIDHDIFALLAEGAATALFAANLHAESERKARTFRGFLDLLTE